MADSVKIMAASKANMPKLPVRELCWAKDENELYIGTHNGNKAVTATVNAALEAQIRAVKDAMHPVGCVYTSTVNTSPATLFGGTWEAVESMTPFVKDNTTGDSYKVIVDNGVVTVESVDNPTTFYSWKRTK